MYKNLNLKIINIYLNLLIILDFNIQKNPKHVKILRIIQNTLQYQKLPKKKYPKEIYKNI